MNDLFDYEQNIFDKAMLYSAESNDKKYGELAKEYGKMLKQLRIATRISDRATITLNTSKHDLLDKVHYDALTGIYNRRFIQDSLKRIIKSQARSKSALSVMMIDVDCFKKFNDTYGHTEGDYALKAIAEIISSTLLRPDDFVARYGGEEFAVVLPGTDERGACLIAGKILKNIRERNIPHSENTAADCVTVSIGVTTSKADRSHSGEEYIEQSDKALYQSKQNGKNRYTYVDFLPSSNTSDEKEAV
jgi:diguanylate cyclase (GGDEF)-like protein